MRGECQTGIIKACLGVIIRLDPHPKGGRPHIDPTILIAPKHPEPSQTTALLGCVVPPDFILASIEHCLRQI